MFDLTTQIAVNIHKPPYSTLIIYLQVQLLMKHILHEVTTYNQRRLKGLDENRQYVIIIAWEGVLYAEYSTRGGVERKIQDEVKPSAVLFSRPCPECYILRTALPPMP